MNRPVSIPLWFCVIVVVLLVYDAFIVPIIGEFNRQTAVTNLKNPATIEHDKLGQFLVDTFNNVISSGRADRQLEHKVIMNETAILKNDTAIIIMMLKNGTN